MEAELAEKLGARVEKQSFPKATALGVDGKTKQFKRFGLYGGLLAENNTQAVARDILVNGMKLAERANYPVVGTVYDEMITEVDQGLRLRGGTFGADLSAAAVGERAAADRRRICRKTLSQRLMRRP